jgi:cyclase
LLLIDTKLPEFTEGIVTKLAGDNPVKTLLVIDTHCHSDHISGNKSWKERGALIAAHENTLKHLETGSYSPLWNERTPPAETGMLPSLSFQESITLHLNGDEIAVSHLTGHTDGDVTVYFRKANVIHLGDIVLSAAFPNSDLVDGGSIDLQILAVKHILTFIDEETVIITGHGPGMTRKDLEKCHDMMTDIRDQIGRQVQIGHTLDQVIASRPTSAYENDWEYGSVTRDRYIELIYRHIMAAEKQ